MKTRATIGMLSGLVTTSLKFGSFQEIAKKKQRSPRSDRAQTGFVQLRYETIMRTKPTMPSVTKTVGLRRLSMNSLANSGILAFEFRPDSNQTLTTPEIRELYRGLRFPVRNSKFEFRISKFGSYKGPEIPPSF